MKAIWNNQILAESDQTVLVEGNHYFPADSLHLEFFKESTAKSVCSWKGEASYYDILVKNKINKEAAWFYPQTKDNAKHIEGMIAFWRGVEVLA